MLMEGRAISSQSQRLELNTARAAEWLLDLIFPPACSNCGRVDFRFCTGCLHELERAPVAVSRRRIEALDGLGVTGKHRGLLRNAVRAFKYDGARDLAMPLADRLVKALRMADWLIDAIVPVPLFADREAERGYNQSELLCQQVALATGIPARAEVLRRIRQTSQQALLSEADRRENVRNAFEASAGLSGLSVLLVDDVATTGATLGECASALRASGASKVYGIAVSYA